MPVGSSPTIVLLVNNLSMERCIGNLAITRSLGDVDLKAFVTGRPYTSRIGLRPGEDSFFIVACDGLWDVVSDMSACTYIAYTEDPNEAAHMLVDYALEQGSTDNVSVIVVILDWDRFDRELRQ